MTHFHLTKLILLLISFLTFSNCRTSPTSRASEVKTPIPLSVNLPKEIKRSPIYTSMDFGKTWNPIGKNLPKKTQVTFMKILGNEMVIASDNEGVLLSSNNKMNWNFISKDLPNKKINALHIFENEILVGVYRKGVFSTKDQGKTWANLNFDLPNLSLQAIFKNENIFLVGGDEGIFKFDSKKNKWIEKFGGAQVLSFNFYNKKIVAGTSMGILLSEDDGESWSWVHQDGALHYTEIIDGKIYGMYVHGDFFISEDWGKKWYEVSYFPRQGSYIYDVAKLGNKLVLSNNYGIHQSSDGGMSWNLVYPTEEMGFFEFVVEGDILYGGTRSWGEYRKRKK